MKNKSVTLTIITVISAFYLIELIHPDIIKSFALYRWDYFSVTHEYYRLLTVALVHDNSSTIPLHLILNMFNLYIIGTMVEAYLGRARYLAVFFISLVTGSLASSLFMDWYGISIGASGAVYGVLGAFAVLGNRNRESLRSAFGLVAVTVIVGLTIPGIDWRAHIGGLIGGAATTAVLLATTKRF
mgnify:CR=1 FL=1